MTAGTLPHQFPVLAVAPGYPDCLRTAPANDDFANATPISGTNLIVTGSNVNATREPGEPMHGQINGVNSIWWSWTAPGNGTATISVTGDTLFTWGAYLGDRLNALTTVASSYLPQWPNMVSSKNFAVQAGTNYHIAVDGWDASSWWSGWENSVVVLTASNEAIVVVKALTITDPPAVHGPLISVFQGDAVTNLSLVPSNSVIVWSSHRPWQLLGETMFRAVAGTSCQIALDTVNDSAGELQVEFVILTDMPPANDSFAARAIVSGTSLSVNGSNWLATAELGEPPNPFGAPNSSVWWSWLAPARGRVAVQVTAPFFKTNQYA